LRAEVAEAQVRVRRAHQEWQQERVAQARSLAAARGPDGRPWYDSVAWDGPAEGSPHLPVPLHDPPQVTAPQQEPERARTRPYEGAREQDGPLRPVTQIDDVEHERGWER
jgi:hypothetical protein